MSSKSPLDTIEVSPERLSTIQNRLTANWEALQEEHGLALQVAYSTEDAIHIEVRAYGDAERKPTEEELEKFKKILFDTAGEPFPLELSVRECCESEPQVTGKIEAVENNRVLIVHETKKNGNTDDPEAYWVTLTPDGSIYDGNSEPASEPDDSLVGKQAKAWTTGMVNESYPAQTAALKIVVE